MPIQTITLRTPTPMTLNDTLMAAGSYVPIQVTEFLYNCTAADTLTTQVSIDENNVVKIERNFDSSVVDSYKEVSHLVAFSNQLTELGWAVTIDPAAADL